MKAQYMALLGIVLLAGCNGTSTEDGSDSGQSSSAIPGVSGGYPIVDTSQNTCTNLTSVLSNCPQSGESTFGQDAQYAGYTPSYTNNGDGTITDNVTGLMWLSTTDTNGDGAINKSDKLSFDEGAAYADALVHAGYSDWRVPNIKELYSLILFDGTDPSGVSSSGSYSIMPFIHIDYFDFNSGDMDAGERLIDSQYMTSTRYVTTTMNDDETMFGVNFIDGRIKGYGLVEPQTGEDKGFYVLLVRGNSDYGKNLLSDPGDGTITDSATGLTWQQGDSGTSMDFPAALSYCENLDLAGRSDWRLPNVKELQSIVDYTRSPETTYSAAIDPVFSATSITNENGVTDWGMYWSSTTHLSMQGGHAGAYVAFGRAMGYMNGNWLDVHGAGAQRSDPKVGDASDYPTGHGPQGDAIRIDNMVRCVTDDYSQFESQPTQTQRTAFSVTID